jgi:alpha-mannosidase
MLASTPVGLTILPSRELEKIWKEVLLYQFHDILPGSSIKRDMTKAWHVTLF